MSGLAARVEAGAGRLCLDLTLEVAAGEVVALVGPNGAGKTTLLRVLAGLHPLTTGRVTLGGRRLDDTEAGIRLPSPARRVGLVPQDGALFRHLSARDNVAFGLRARGMRRAAASAAATAMLDRLEIGGLAEARPGALSGGQAQRVALARALVTDPALLLLDEPLSALDRTAQVEVRRALRRHLTAYDGVAILVTHDPLDAVILADRLVVLEDGRVTQDASAADVARAPRSPWAARLLGWNAYRGVLTATGLSVEGGALVAADPLPAGGEGLAVVPPWAVAVHRERPEGSPRNAWPGVVGELSMLGGRVRVHIDGPVPVVAEVTAAGAAALHLGEGAEVWTSVKATEVTLAAL
ncbi:MAG: ABC transporter ATP-binding protein [Mycobacteriales bacterium]